MRDSPEILVHGFEKEFVAGLVQDLFEIQQRDFLSRDGDFHQVRRLLLVYMVDYFGFRHFALLRFSVPRPNEEEEGDCNRDTELVPAR